MAVWLALVLLLHVLALHALGVAFAPIEPGRLPEPIFARLLTPSVRPAPVTGLAAKPQAQTAASQTPATQSLQLQPSPEAATPRPAASTPAPAKFSAPSASAAHPAASAPVASASASTAAPAARPDLAASQAQLGRGAPPVEPAPHMARSLGDGNASGQVAVSRPPKAATSTAQPTVPGALAAAASQPLPGMTGGQGAQAAGVQASAAAAMAKSPQTALAAAQSARSGETAQPAAAGSTPVRPAAADTFGWPPSTELRYELSGNYRGPLHGDGALRWVRDGDSYQLEISGAALVSFSYTSTGRIDGNWLAPSRYVERVFTRRKAVNFNRDQGTLSFSAISTVMPLPQHLQDSASIFMQLAHQLTTQPQDFRVGQHLAFEVARPSGTTTWDFSIVGQDTLQTGVGPLVAWHLDHPADSHGLGAEVWLAPALQNLPVQIRLQQSDDNYLLFTLREARQQ